MDTNLEEVDITLYSGDIQDTEVVSSKVEKDINEVTIQKDDNVNIENNQISNSGNTHIMIIVVSICAIVGIALGIWRGKKAITK